ncbi:1-acyl-sn-glycerol-3-phosphate acyltransferase [Conyzicola nivalis]|uniref:1-acyl-sn-glycerol-3-phosphate acyltransferase n=1 Tax=Conyzicola nivalis TaxID=1477021 RepID=A0ABV2QM61_9MICO
MTDDRGPGSEKTPIFRLLAAIAVPPMNLMAKLRLSGVENVPRTGAFVLAPNHYSEIDPLVVGVAMWKIGRMPRYMAKASLFKIPVVGRLLHASGQIPVERAGSRGSDPLAAARQIADQGLAVVIYPEGTLTRDPDLWPMRGKSGAVRTALEQGIPVIPVAHWGTQLLMPRYGKKISVFPRKTIDVRFGPAVDLSAFAGRKLDSATLTEATDVVMDAITAIFEELRGQTAPAERWDPAKHNQKDTGRFEQ